MSLIKILIFIIFSKITFSYINIYPSKFEKNITNGAKESFKLYNRTEKQVKYRIYLEEGKENDMSNWIEIYPRSITLKPLEEKEIRLLINTPKNAKLGKYKAKLIIKEIEVPGKKKKEKVNFMTRLKLNMVGNIEDDIK